MIGVPGYLLRCSERTRLLSQSSVNREELLLEASLNSGSHFPCDPEWVRTPNSHVVRLGGRMSNSLHAEVRVILTHPTTVSARRSCAFLQGRLAKWTKNLTSIVNLQAALFSWHLDFGRPFPQPVPLPGSQFMMAAQARKHLPRPSSSPLPQPAP